MDKKINNLISLWQKRNISGSYFEARAGAVEEALNIIPVSATVGICGSKTLDELGLVNILESRGNKIFNQYKTGITRDESLELRRQGTQADYYLMSANAVSEKGELVFFSAYGNRTAGAAYARKLIVICGINKITPNLEEALKRAREYATPLNCRRLAWNSACLSDGICRKEACQAPEYRRMCAQVLVIEAEVTSDRLRVILVGEALGF